MLGLSCDQFSDGSLFDVIAAPPETISNSSCHATFTEILVVYQIQLTSFSKKPAFPYEINFLPRS
jgi:hypothetical protein